MSRGKEYLLLSACLASLACRQDMHNQPRYKPFAATAFFGDGRSERPVVEGTVARGHLHTDRARYTGKVDGEDVTEFPFPHFAMPSTVACWQNSFLTFVFANPSELPTTRLGNTMTTCLSPKRKSVE